MIDGEPFCVFCFVDHLYYVKIDIRDQLRIVVIIVQVFLQLYLQEGVRKWMVYNIDVRAS